MKALIVYYTMGGRTKKVAESIANALTKYDVSFFPVILTGRFIEKIKQFDKFEKDDFTTIEDKLKTLDVSSYDLILFGMPVYGDKPPNTFNEIIKRMSNLEGKEVITFVTARFTGKGTLQYMKDKIEAKKAKVIDQKNFKRFFGIGKKVGMKYGQQINDR
ncbi:MAG: flavodoxin family protein [Asgard group archaeon]|nr:flavodoxin family protein [Asgard group archaeon]